MGLTKAIGVCNFDIRHLKKLIENPRTEIIPMVNQSHFHPEYTCKELRKYCEDHGIVFGGLFLDDHTKQSTKSTIFTDAWFNGEYFETSEEKKLANDEEFGEDDGPNVFRRMIRYHREEGFIEHPYKKENNPRLDRFYYEGSAPVRQLAEKYGKTTAQIVERWSLQHGVVTLVKTLDSDEMKTLIDVFDFELTPEDMKVLDGLNVDRRIGYHPDFLDF